MQIFVSQPSLKALYENAGGRVLIMHPFLHVFCIVGSTGWSANTLRKHFVSYSIATELRDTKLGGIHHNLQAGASSWIAIIQAILETAQVGVQTM